MCVSTFDQNSDVSLWRSGHGECGRYIGLITVQLLEEKKLLRSSVIKLQLGNGPKGFIQFQA